MNWESGRLRGWEKALQAEETAGKGMAGAGSGRRVLWEEGELG